MHELVVNTLNRKCENQTNYLNFNIWVELKEMVKRRRRKGRKRKLPLR